jgi:hypothetical protein
MLAFFLLGEDGILQKLGWLKSTYWNISSFSENLFTTGCMNSMANKLNEGLTGKKMEDVVSSLENERERKSCPSTATQKLAQHPDQEPQLS